jgi:hypothetical protein
MPESPMPPDPAAVDTAYAHMKAEINAALEKALSHASARERLGTACFWHRMQYWGPDPVEDAAWARLFGELKARADAEQHLQARYWAELTALPHPPLTPEEWASLRPGQGAPDDDPPPLLEDGEEAAAIVLLLPAAQVRALVARVHQVQAQTGCHASCSDLVRTALDAYLQQPMVDTR